MGARRRIDLAPGVRTEGSAWKASHDDERSPRSIGARAAFNIIHSDGSSAPHPSGAAFADLFDELRTADREHGDVSVVHEESGWSLSAHRDGRAVFELLECGGERHMLHVSKEKVLALWGYLADGNIDALLAAPWQPGYGP